MHNYVLSPEGLRSLLHWQLEHRREMLLYTLLQSHCGLRPEEAYRVLKGPHQYFLGTSHLVVPSTLTKGTPGRKVALCPAFCTWLEKVPGWTDSQADLRPRDRNGQPLSSKSLRAMLRRQIRKCDQQKCGRDVLRRGWLRACVALGTASPKLAAEAGLPFNGHRRHLDTYWTKDMAEKWFGIFPPDPGGPSGLPPNPNPSDDHSTGSSL